MEQRTAATPPLPHRFARCGSLSSQMLTVGHPVLVLTVLPESQFSLSHLAWQLFRGRGHVSLPYRGPEMKPTRGGDMAIQKPSHPKSNSRSEITSNCPAYTPVRRHSQMSLLIWAISNISNSNGRGSELPPAPEKTSGASAASGAPKDMETPCSLTQCFLQLSARATAQCWAA